MVRDAKPLLWTLGLSSTGPGWDCRAWQAHQGVDFESTACCGCCLFCPAMLTTPTWQICLSKGTRAETALGEMWGEGLIQTLTKNSPEHPFSSPQGAWCQGKKTISPMDKVLQSSHQGSWSSPFSKQFFRDWGSLVSSLAYSLA